MDSHNRLGEEKNCTVCGRRFGWRRRWASQWEQVRHCSAACRRRRLTDKDRSLEAAILSMLGEQPHGGEIGLDDVAQKIDANWRQMRERAREAGRRLCAEGKIEFVQGGRVVDASSAKGPVAVRLTKSP